MLRVVVVTSVMHAVVGFAQVPRNTAQESLETRTSGTGPTVQCGEKVSKKCLAQKVDAMEARVNTFMFEGPHYDRMYSIEAQLQAQIQQLLRPVGTAEAQMHPADTCDYN